MRRQSQQAGNATKTRHGQVDAVPTSFCVQEEHDASTSPIVKLPSCWHNQTNCGSCRFARAGFTMRFHSAGPAAPIDPIAPLACRHACVLLLEMLKVGGNVPFAIRFCCRQHWNRRECVPCRRSLWTNACISTGRDVRKPRLLPDAFFCPGSMQTGYRRFPAITEGRKPLRL